MHRFAEMPCPAARSLDVIGEWWTLLIVRDALFGAKRFEDFKATGIADNILSARLKRLVEEGIFVRQPYQGRPERFEYLLTEKGLGLVPVLVSLLSWGKEWTTGDDFTHVRHRGHDHDVSVRLHCDECGRPVTLQELEPILTGELAPSHSQ